MNDTGLGGTHEHEADGGTAKEGRDPRFTVNAKLHGIQSLRCDVV
jgi:hypothetical protein